MASNFGIAIDKSGNGSGLVLEGDFDATSAHELIYAIKKMIDRPGRVHIQTNGLKNIYPFGLDVFLRFMCSLNGQSAKVVFTGKNASQLSSGNFCLGS